MASLRRPKRLNAASPSHVRAPRQEAAVAKRLGGEVVPGSGCGNMKGDVRVPKLIRLECKTTDKKSFSVTRALMAKIESEGMPYGELPFLEVEFNTNGKKVGSVCVVPSWVLDMVVGGRE